jgi:predicted transcriptional regulator
MGIILFWDIHIVRRTTFKNKYMPKVISKTEQMILQKLLRDVRKEANLSQQELAIRLGKPQSFVSKYESGERRLDIIELYQVCQAIQISLADFTKRLENLLLDKSNAT